MICWEWNCNARFVTQSQGRPYSLWVIHAAGSRGNDPSLFWDPRWAELFDDNYSLHKYMRTRQNRQRDKQLHSQPGVQARHTAYGPAYRWRKKENKKTIMKKLFRVGHRSNVWIKNKFAIFYEYNLKVACILWFFIIPMYYYFLAFYVLLRTEINS